MSADSSWRFFAHETDLAILEQTLANLYGIHLNHFQCPTNLNKLFEHALMLCGSLSTNDQTFFDHVSKEMQSNLLDHLVIDALFHVRKDHSKETVHRSLQQFIEEISKHYSTGRVDSANFSRYMKQDFMSSLYPPLLRLAHNAPNSNYRVPKFMDRLLFLLITTIKKSPYRYSTPSDISFSMLKTFFVSGDICAKIRSAYQDDVGNQCIATYLSNRLFDIDTMVYIIDKLRNRTSPFTHETILPYLMPIFFVPNTFGKRAYCDLMFDLLDRNHEISTHFDHWNRPNDEIGYVKADQTPTQIEETNLIKCKQYLMFLSSTYFPVLNACFYALLLKTYTHLADIDAILSRYINQSDIQHRAELQENDWKAKLSQFDSKEKTHFAQLYQQIHDTFSNEGKYQQWQSLTSLNYLSPNSPYQKAILETVLKEKFGTHNRNTAKFITFS